MSALVTARLEGEERLIGKFNRPSWVSGPNDVMVQTWIDHVRQVASAKAPKYMGELARSFQGERGPGIFPTYAEVTSSSGHAAPMEWGTGTLSEAPDSSHVPHWPPGRALEGWAQAHGLNGFAVARAIGLRGGLEPRRFMRDANKEAEFLMPGWLFHMARQIEAEGSR